MVSRAIPVTRELVGIQVTVDTLDLACPVTLDIVEQDYLDTVVTLVYPDTRVILVTQVSPDIQVIVDTQGIAVTRDQVYQDTLVTLE